MKVTIQQAMDAYDSRCVKDDHIYQLYDYHIHMIYMAPAMAVWYWNS